MMTKRRPRRILMIRQSGVFRTQSVPSLCNALSDLGNQISLAVLDGVADRQRLNHSVKLMAHPMNHSSRSICGRIQAARFLRQCLYSEDYDIIYVLDSWTILAFWMATLGTMRARGKPVVYHTFDWLEPGHVSGIHIALERRMSRSSDLNVNADRARARMQRTVYGLDETPIWVQNALLIKEPVPDPDSRSWEDILGRPKRDGERIIIYPTAVAGDASRDRQVYELLLAMTLLPDSYTAILFAGEGEERLRCQSLVEEKRLADRVIFLSPVPFDTLISYVSSSDCGVMFYSDETSSGYFMCNADKLSLYAACGIPYVASKFPNLEAMTYKHGLGVCCDSSDPSDIATAFTALKERFPSGQKTRSRIRAVFENELCLEKNIQTLSERLGEL